MSDLDKGVIAADTAINSDGFAPGIAQPTTMAEIKDIYTSTRSVVERTEALRSLRGELVSRYTADTEGGYEHLIAEIGHGLGLLSSPPRGSADPDVLRQRDTAVDPSHLSRKR